MFMSLSTVTNNNKTGKINLWAPVKKRNLLTWKTSAKVIKVKAQNFAELKTLQSSMSWRKHIVQVFEKASKRLNMLKFVRFKVDRSILTSLYKSLIRPLMEYGDVIWNNCYDCDSALLDGVHVRSLDNY